MLSSVRKGKIHLHDASEAGATSAPLAAPPVAAVAASAVVSVHLMQHKFNYDYYYYCNYYYYESLLLLLLAWNKNK